MEANVEKINFFKRLKIALIELEGYIRFLGERFSKCVFFVFKVSFILSFILAVTNVAFIFVKYGSVEGYINEKVPEFSIVDGKIEIDEEDKKDDDKKDVVNVIDNFSEEIDFSILKDGYNKSDFINDVNENLTKILVSVFVGILIANFLELSIFWFINAIMTSLIGYLMLMISRIKMRYSGIYSMSIYANTLSTILTVVYSVSRMYFDVYIDIFDYLYMIISYIYISAVILMIRAELIKQHIEIIKVVTKKQEEKEESIDDRVKEEKEPNADKKEKQDEEEDNKDKNLKEPDGTCNFKGE